MRGGPSHLLRLSALEQRLKDAGVDCRMEAPRWDVPKLYAVCRGRTGPHEIVCASADQSLDLWCLSAGRTPRFMKTLTGDDEAFDIVVSDYRKAVAS